MDEIDLLLEKGLDKLALQLSCTAFYQEYLLARNPISNGKSKPAETPPTQHHRLRRQLRHSCRNNPSSLGGASMTAATSSQKPN